MCLDKQGKSMTFKTDLYVLKYTTKRFVSSSSFPSNHVDFVYFTKTIYKKDFITRLEAFFGNGLYREVYHAFSPLCSLRIARSKQSDKSENYYTGTYGVFRIPAGTRIYPGDNQDLGVTCIEYIGLLEGPNINLVIDSCNLNMEKYARKAKKARR